MRTLTNLTLFFLCTVWVISFCGAAPPSPYSDTNLWNEFTALGNNPTTNQINRLSNNLKANGIDFNWTTDEMLKLETAQHATSEQITALQKILRDSGVVKDPAKKTGDVISLLLFTGARLQNPYSISVDTTTQTGTLKTGNSTSDGFIELDLGLRYIYRTGDFDDQYLQQHPDRFRAFWQDADGKLCFYGFYPDYDLRLGYSFAGSSAPTNFNVSTIAQGSDFYLDSSIGLPLARYSSGSGLKAQGTLEIAGGFTTDKDVLLIHPNLFIGGGLQLASLNLNSSGSSTFGNTYFLLRTGMAAVDQPKLIGANTVAVDSLGRPEFNWTWAPSVGSTVILKLNQSFAAQLGANAYFTDVPSWNISIGISVDPEKLFNIH